MTQVALTGASGHVGAGLVRELVTRGYRVRAVLRTPDNAPALDGIDVERVAGELADVPALVRAFSGADIVFHVAALVSIMPGMARPLHDTNVDGTRNVLTACREARIRRLVYTSSIHAVPAPPHGQTVDESRPYDPEQTAGDYDRSKAEATLEVLAAARDGLDAVVVNPTAVIGPYDFKGSLLGDVFVSFAKGKLPAYVPGAYDFVDVRDVAVGHVLAAEKGQRGESYLLSGHRATLPELMAMLEELSGRRRPRLVLPVWAARATAVFGPAWYRLTGRKPRFTPYAIHTLQTNTFISNAKAQRELGFANRPLRDTLRDALQWYRDNGRM